MAMSTPTVTTGLTDEQRDALKAFMRSQMDAEMDATATAGKNGQSIEVAYHHGRKNAFFDIWRALDANRL